ncbi:hypothetical protein [Alkaliphilus crotonatoxidans]
MSDAEEIQAGGALLSETIDLLIDYKARNERKVQEMILENAKEMVSLLYKIDENHPDFNKQVERHVQMTNDAYRMSKIMALSTGYDLQYNLPNKTIGSNSDGKIEHYYRSGDHAPAHVHVTDSQGNTVKVGQNGKPLLGEPELNRQQQQLVNTYKKEIRKAISNIMKWHKNR